MSERHEMRSSEQVYREYRQARTRGAVAPASWFKFWARFGTIVLFGVLVGFYFFAR